MLIIPENTFINILMYSEVVRTKAQGLGWDEPDNTEGPMSYGHKTNLGS